GLELTPLDIDTRATPFDLVLALMEEEGGIIGSLDYRTALFEQPTITRLEGHYRRLLEAIAADPEQRIGDLPWLTPAERRTLVVEWNRTQAEGPEGCCIHELFAEQAARTPNAVAVLSDDQQLTYRELDERANLLARYLVRAGAGPEVRVGICLERS